MPLPTHLLREPPAKTVRFFPAVKVDTRDPDGAFLRVSCYLRDQTIETDDGSVVIPGRHVRFSVWSGDSARCVLSLSEAEARELSQFIVDELDRTTVS
jgi:hypothetical protein